MLPAARADVRFDDGVRADLIGEAVTTPDLGRVTHGGGIATGGVSIYIPTKDGFPKDVLVVDATTYEVVDTIEPLDLNALALDDGALWATSGRLAVGQRFDLPA